MSGDSLFGTALATLGVLALFGAGGAYCSAQKHRSTTEGFILGFLLGPLGMLIAALLPTLPAPPAIAAEPADEEQPAVALDFRVMRELDQAEEIRRRRRAVKNGPT